MKSKNTERSSNSKLLGAVVAGLAAGAISAALAPAATWAADGGKVECYGVNKCKGEGACGGPGRSCAGTNSCKRKGFVELDKEICLKLEGASLKPLPEGEPVKGTEKKKSPPAQKS